MSQLTHARPGQAARLPVTASMATGGRVETIDAVRGLACLWVLLHHSLIYWGWRVYRPVLWHLQDVARVGYLGVHLFLVLSGFVLFYPVVRRHGVRQATVDPRAFLLKRARRILPPYYLALAGFLAVGLWPAAAAVLGSPFDLRSGLLHLTMLFNLDPASIALTNGSFWSLALEFQLYLTFPLLLWACRQAGLAAVVCGTLAVAVAWQVVVAPRMVPAAVPGAVMWPWQAVWYYAVPGRCCEFAMGMAAAAAVARPRRHTLAAAAVLAGVTLPFAVRLVMTPNQFGPVRDQAWGVVFAATVVLTAAAPAWVAASAAVRGAGWLGGISYSVYLIHQPLLQLSRLALDRAGIAVEYRLAVFGTVALPLLIALGWGFHLVAERPFMTPAKRPPLAPAAGPVALRDAVPDRRIAA